MFCKICNGSDFIDAIDLGMLPIAESLTRIPDINIKTIETKMIICSNCGLGQLTVDAFREELFDDYTFKTAESSSFLLHVNNFVKNTIKKYNINKNDWVLDLATNDGSVLKIFKEYGINGVGVDPAKNITIYGICNDIPIITDFFGSSLAKEILRIKGYPKLIIANNVLAHVPNPKDFMEGISILSSNDTIVSIENPHIINILTKYQFDTIYHGHYCYLSCMSVSNLSNMYGLKLFDTELINVHGGSRRYWLSKNQLIKPSVNECIEKEKNSGFLDEKKWTEYNYILSQKINNFKQHLNELKIKGAKIFGYAASSKCTTVLNYAKIDKDLISAIADDAYEKQGKYIPKVNIPIISLKEMINQNPTDVIIFSWNIYNELVEKLTDMGYNGKIWTWDYK